MNIALLSRSTLTTRKFEGGNLMFRVSQLSNILLKITNAGSIACAVHNGNRFVTCITISQNQWLICRLHISSFKDY